MSSMKQNWTFLENSHALEIVTNDVRTTFLDADDRWHLESEMWQTIFRYFAILEPLSWYRKAVLFDLTTVESESCEIGQSYALLFSKYVKLRISE